MIKKTLERLGFNPEDIKKIEDGLKDDKVYTTSLENADERYNKLKQQKEDLDGQVKTANDAITDLKKSNKDNEDLQTKVKDYEGTIETLKKDSESKVKNLTLDNAINTLLAKNKAKHSDLIVGKFDRDKLNIKEDGTIEGLYEQFTSIKESYKDLFTEEIVLGGNDPNFKGNPAGGTEVLSQTIASALKGNW